MPIEQPALYPEKMAAKIQDGGGFNGGGFIGLSKLYFI